MTNTSEKDFCLNHKLTGEGVRDVDPKEVQSTAHSIKLIDVRRPEEFMGELGHSDSAKLVTLETQLQNFLSTATPEQKNAPTVFICRSGGRSTRAAALAQQSGFTNVYNMTGGMMYWNELRLPVSK